MPANVSDRLRVALEHLDEAIDRLDARVAEHMENPASGAPDRVIADRLDRIIERLELALAD
jgi:hypothetical protein